MAGLLDRLRHRAITARTATARAYWMRAYLRHKALAGMWDKRMLNGCPDTRHTPTRRYIMRGVAAGLVTTATSNGEHAPGSFHKTGQAADMGLRPAEVGTKKGLGKLRKFQAREFRNWHRYHELLGPTNAQAVLGGYLTTLTEGSDLEQQHDNHVHGAAAR